MCAGSYDSQSPGVSANGANGEHLEKRGESRAVKYSHQYSQPEYVDLNCGGMVAVDSPAGR